MSSIISISNLHKHYGNKKTGHTALSNINLTIERGEIFALLGPNGAGKSTLINSICGIVNPTSGSILVDGHDVVKEYKATRRMIGLVPQELTTDTFETVLKTVTFTRGLFGKPPNPSYIESLLKQLSLWEKRNEKILALSGGMKRRVLIAKALAHQPDILFLDEPTAGVDVELRRDMWKMVRTLCNNGTTVILTTHYIEEAEDMANRIGVISHGEIILVEDKHQLMKKLGKKTLSIQLKEPLSELPTELSSYQLERSESGLNLIYRYEDTGEQSDITSLLRSLDTLGIDLKDLNSKQSSLEEIFVNLVRESK